MKIMHIAEAFGGGVYSFLVSLCNSMSEEYETTVVYSERKETPSNFRSDFNPNTNFIKLNMTRGINPINDLISLFCLMRLISRERPDIIHLHSSKAGFLGRLACWLLCVDRKNVFYNPHGYSFLQQNSNIIIRKLFFGLEAIATRLSGTIVAVSKGEYDEAVKINKYSKLINNAIDTDYFKRNAEEAKSTEKEFISQVTIATSGRITYARNPKLFNDIALQFPQYKFIWIGDGELREILNSNNITVTGWKTKSDVINELKRVQIYIQTSLWEGMPLALLEAMALGKAVVVTNVIGNRDVVSNGENGYVANDVGGFIAIIRELINNRTLITKLGIAASLYVEKHHSLNGMLNEYKELYNSTNNIVPVTSGL